MVPVPAAHPLTVENVLWSNTVLAAGSAVGFVIYTGSETRAVMNTSHPATKIGLLDLEINNLSKVSFSQTSYHSGVFKTLADPLCSHIRSILCPGCIEWIPWTVVHVHYFDLPLLDPLLVYHPYQVTEAYFLFRVVSWLITHTQSTC